MENFKKYERLYLSRVNGYKKLLKENIDWTDLLFTLFDRNQFLFNGVALFIKRPAATAFNIAAGLCLLHNADPSFFDYDLRHLQKYDLDVAHGILSHINYLLNGVAKETKILVFMALLIAGDCAFILNAYLNYQRLHKNQKEFQEYLSYYYFLAIYNDSADVAHILASHGVDLGDRLSTYSSQQLPYTIAQEIRDKYIQISDDYVVNIIKNDPVMFCICFKSEKVLKFLIKSNLTITDNHVQCAKKHAPDFVCLLEEKINTGRANARTTRPITTTMMRK